MKKRMIVNYLIAVTFLIFFTGCGKNKNGKTTTTTTNTPTTEHVHEFGEWMEISKPTCSEEGFRKRVCSCGIAQTEIIPTVDHDYVNDKCKVCKHERLTEGFNVYYQEDDDLYHINDYTGSSTTVRIPYLYDDGTNGEHKLYIDREFVEGEYESSLKDCNIEKIIIGSGYETIGKNMFSGLNNLLEVVIEADAKLIEDNAFYNCPKLETVTFNDDLEQIGFYAFAKCNFNSVSLPYYLKKIGAGAFSDNTELSTISYYYLTEIGDNAFNNTALENIRIPYSLTYFGFQGKMSSLINFNIDSRNTIFEFKDGCLINKETNSLVKCISGATIPDNIVELYPYSLSYLDLSSITKVIIPDSVKNIGYRTFYNTKVNDIDFGKVEVIEENALTNIIFTNADEVTITLPETIIEIEFHAFQELECNEIILPLSVEVVGYAIFEDCVINSIKIHSTTLGLEDCDQNWDYGIDDETTTITIIED